MPPKKTNNKTKKTSNRTSKSKTSAKRATRTAKTLRKSATKSKTAAYGGGPANGETVNVRGGRVRKDSFAIATDAIRTQREFHLPEVDQLKRALDVDDKKAKAVQKHLEDFALWIKSDKQRALEFETAPVRLMTMRDPALAIHLQMIHPKLLELLLGPPIPFCDELPSQTEYADCIRGILKRVAYWMQLNLANRSVFKSNTDTAVESAAGSAPSVAKMLAKQALRSARGIQRGAA